MLPLWYRHRRTFRAGSKDFLAASSVLESEAHTHMSPSRAWDILFLVRQAPLSRKAPSEQLPASCSTRILTDSRAATAPSFTCASSFLSVHPFATWRFEQGLELHSESTLLFRTALPNCNLIDSASTAHLVQRRFFEEVGIAKFLADHAPRLSLLR